MAPNATDANDGEVAEPRTADPAPSRLARIREQRRGENPELQEKIMAATLVATGELGYRKATVAEVLLRYGGYRVQFYQQFASLDEAYAIAYFTHAERLTELLLAAGAAESSWRAGLGAALAALGRFVGAQPALAGGLLLQVHVAGEPALGKRKEVLERLSRAIDSARRETGSRHSPPPLTAPFMVSAIESTVVRALVQGEPERLEREMGELDTLIARTFF